MYDTEQTAFKPAARIRLTYLEENLDEFHYQFCIAWTLTCTCDGNINIADTKILKLFRGGLFDRRGYFGANAP